MLRALLLSLLLLAGVVRGEDVPSAVTTVTTAQLDAAVGDVTANLAPDDPKRADLLRLYGDTRAALVAVRQFRESEQSFAQARAGAAGRAAAIEAGLAERELSASRPAADPANESLADIEQQMQVGKAELDARRTRMAELNAAISGVPDRSAEIRTRLTELGSLLPKLQSQLSLLPKTVEPGSAEEASLWLAQAQVASAIAEKASLDEELLSQPMRLQLLAAQQDLAGQDIRKLERRLQSLDRRAGSLRQGEANQAQVEAEKVVAGAQGKHQLVQQLADDNAALSASFGKVSSAIESVRQRDLVVGEQAGRLEADLKGIEHKLSILGMTTAVGHILREQEAQLPRQREFEKDLESLRVQITNASVRQLELADARRKLASASEYVDHLSQGLDEQVSQLIREDLLELARNRRDLVKQALELENTYFAALGSLELDLRRYADAAGAYRKFTSERLLWIPSRAPFTLLREDGVKQQFEQLFAADRWGTVMRQLPLQLVLQPEFGIGLLLVLALFYRGPALKARLLASGREVGFVRTDQFSNTLLALWLTLLQSVKWPLLMWSVGQLFEQQELESELATALHVTLTRSAAYFWGFEFLRATFAPKGLVDAHFRWPSSRTANMHHRVARLEQTIIPSIVLVVFALALFPQDVGGPLGAVGVVLVLLSIASFFRLMPQFMQWKVSMALLSEPDKGSSLVAKLIHLSLVWVPLATTVAVLFGYIYTALEFSLLLLKTMGLFAALLLFHELGLRWLRMARRRMVVQARTEAAQAVEVEGEAGVEEDLLESDFELLSDDGTRLLNIVTLIGMIVGVMVVWSAVLPALGILDSVELWHQTSVVEGQQVILPVTLGKVLFALIISVLGWVLLGRIPGLLEILLRQKMGVRPASAYAATRVFQYAATGVLVAAVLSSLGGSWSQIQWAVAALSVGIGFGLQEIVANFISGLIILFEQPIRVGDTVTVGTISGRVTKIRIRATTIRDFDRRELLVPNKEFITQQLLNWSLSDQVTRWVVEVGVAYGTDLDKAMAEIHAAVLAQPLILKDPEPTVTFEQFGDSSLLIRARFFMDQLDQRLKTSSDLMLDINRRLHAAGIVVAFPQRDVHLDTSQPLEIRMLRGERAASVRPDPATS
ncbi:MAG: mechanosensitive ion channel [Halioglobus sp.]|nr:mechanosensitive ion channel [Halioglobus sp.]MCB1708995.1 mechanosensitive ion channel [Halioglobus sp.]MCP5123551.1 mechanosensitive ion channel [Pseudomonadales bacterium]MCP5193611.1 mechanosensitive ion channel [Pseudomonadales bacterium]